MRGETFAQGRVFEEGAFEGGGEGEFEEVVVAGVALDEAGPFAELGGAGCEVWLEAVEGGEGVDLGVGQWWGGGDGGHGFGGWVRVRVVVVDRCGGEGAV